MTRWMVFLAALAAWNLPLPAPAFQQDGCGAGDCRTCHDLTRQEATALLGDLPLEVLGVGPSEVPGLWVVDVQNREGRRGPVYVDFSKQFVISGNILRLASKEDVTQKRMIELNRIDPSAIPLEDALVIGNPLARHRLVVFDDPECQVCAKLHPELKKLAAQRPDVGIFLKMFPVNQRSRVKAEAIVCAKSLALLEDSLAGREIPPPGCRSDQVEKNLELGRRIGVQWTPTIVFPDGRVVPGHHTAEALAAELDAGR